MTKDYAGKHFSDPQFLVFCNRIGGLLVASVGILLMRDDAAHSAPDRIEAKTAPLSAYANAALSNILSSWCQYEALVFITFPVQVISKSCKAIPVMLMGRFLYGRSYKAFEYITTGLISVGVSTFILSSRPEHSAKTVVVNSVSGLFLICAYIALDSYTSTFQDNLFRVYKMPSLHMMQAVCCWGVIFTVTPLLSDGSLISAILFARDHPAFVLDVAGSAICSGFGQILIFATISEFGAVTFTIIMTIRMCLSILVSCLLFKHPMNLAGAFGLCVTFGAIFSRIFWKRALSSTHTGSNSR